LSAQSGKLRFYEERANMAYEGTERRRHRLVVTRNTEYHLRDDVCVAVRDRVSKRWCEGHLAVSLRCEGGVKFHTNGALIPSLTDPTPGDAIYFSYRTASGEERQLVTSKIESVGRTPKRDVLAYATLGVRERNARPGGAHSKQSS
jgi:hypothetical protein